LRIPVRSRSKASRPIVEEGGFSRTVPVYYLHARMVRTWIRHKTPDNFSWSGIPLIELTLPRRAQLKRIRPERHSMCCSISGRGTLCLELFFRISQ
jgi:hypothetical protein